jgi:hypothetical protein
MTDRDSHGAVEPTMNFQQRQRFGSRSREGGVSFHEAGPVHIAPAGARDWQPLCGELLGPVGKFTRPSMIPPQTPLCSACRAAAAARGDPQRS